MLLMGKSIKRKSPKTVVSPGAPGIAGPGSFLYPAGILILTFIVFLPSVRNLFVDFDDPQYVLENLYIKAFGGHNLKAIFCEDANRLGNYHPLTLLSFMVNYLFSELSPTGYHVTNVLLHLVNTYLVFRLALLLFTKLGYEHGQKLASVTALLFGIHPMHVESVAWVSGRKDLLYTCFYLLAMLRYIRYLDEKTVKNYLLVLFFFLLSLVSKGMAVTLTLSVIALDYLFGRELRQKTVILEKIPFLLLSLVFGVIAVAVQQAQGATDIIKYGFFQRSVFASFGFTQYLVKFLVPYKLCGYYPYPDLPDGNIPWFYYLSFIPVLVFGFLLLFFLWIRPDRKVAFGMMFFIINVMFVIQLFPVGSAVMADRYTYLSYFGLFFLVASGIGFLLHQFPPARIIIVSLVIVYAGVLSVVAGGRCAAWHDGLSFWQDVAEKYPYFFPAFNNLGVFYEKEGNTAEAFRYYNNSITANHHNPNAYYHRGTIYGKSGRLKEAISDFDQSIRYAPEYTKAYINRAIAKAMIKDSKGALADLNKVLEREKNEEAFFNRGVLENDLKDYAKAIPDFQEAINLNGSCVSCYYSLGLANYGAGRYREAISAFSTCLSLAPGSGMVYHNRALAYIEAGKPDSSCNDLQQAVNLGVKESVSLLEQYCKKK